jgi:hypothetical protein
VKRLRFYTSALLEGSVTPDHIAEDWPDWFQLAPAFVAAYGSYELQELEIGAEFLEAIEEQDDVSLTDAVRAYLKALQAWLDVYPEMRTTEERPDSALWERPVDGGEEIGVLEMQVSRGRRDAGMAHQALDDVDVLAPAHKARGIALTPAVGEVPSGHARRGPGLQHQAVKRPGAVTTTEPPVAHGVSEEVRRRREPGSHLFEVLAEHVH